MQALLPKLGMVAGRSVLMFFLVLVAVRVMGKRSVGQLAPFDLTVIIIMGSVAALPLEEEQIHPIHGIVPIFVMAFLQYVLSVINMHWRGAEKITQGMSTPLIVNGQVLYDNLKRERVSEADLHIVLRQQGADRIEDIALAVLEPTGEVSVIKKKEAQPVTPKDMDLVTLSRIDAIRSQCLERLKDRYRQFERPSSLSRRILVDKLRR
ncbi:MAG TPA: DUF421 domain-containing protein [Firmicutes bacterium]|nr:DUF421 domain-containing protein [Candidatus Fermentithermobacillaceae bacterium]